MLCEKYGLNPLTDICSHRGGLCKGIASNHGDPEHLWIQLGMGCTMDTFNSQVGYGGGNPSSGSTRRIYEDYGGSSGNSGADENLYQGKEPLPWRSLSLICYRCTYLKGNAEGVRGDIAFAQSCLETENFGFSGSAVTLDQNNFCGMGVTSNGMKGNSFDTPQLGIRAQIQHLKAYASRMP